MAIDDYPYSGRNAGAVGDVEYERLVRDSPDGIIIGSDPSACQVAVVTSSRGWTVQPGTIRVAGHNIVVDQVQSGTLTPNTGAPRTDAICAQVDRTASPWTFSIAVVPGTPGGGMPAISVSATQVYQVPLASVQVLSAGGTSGLVDLRPWQAKGLTVDPDTGTLSSGSTVVWEDTGWVACGSGPDGAFYWSTTAPAQVRRKNGQVFLEASETRVGTTYPVGSPGGSALNITIPAGFRPVGRPATFAPWCDSGAGWLVVGTDGSVRLAALTADMPPGYSAHITVDWTI